jgi:hypothetical protein
MSDLHRRRATHPLLSPLGARTLLIPCSSASILIAPRLPPKNRNSILSRIEKRMMDRAAPLCARTLRPRLTHLPLKSGRPSYHNRSGLASGSCAKCIITRHPSPSPSPSPSHSLLEQATQRNFPQPLHRPPHHPPPPPLPPLPPPTPWPFLVNDILSSLPLYVHAGNKHGRLSILHNYCFSTADPFAHPMI